MQNELGFNFDGSLSETRLTGLSIFGIRVLGFAVGKDDSGLAFLGPECPTDLGN